MDFCRFEVCIVCTYSLVSPQSWLKNWVDVKKDWSVECVEQLETHIHMGRGSGVNV